MTDKEILQKSTLRLGVDVPDGNYIVKVLIGDESGKSEVTVKAQTRRLMVKEVVSGGLTEKEFAANVRGGKLTLEFYSHAPLVRGIDVKKAGDVTVIYIAGDSTVCDQGKEPWAGWGQMLPCFFTSKVAIANHTYSGRSTKSFIENGRLYDILKTIKEGDYLFVQFGHNDQKEDWRHTEPYTTYKEMLKIYINEAREKGAIPVLVTPMHRRFFDKNGKIVNTLGQYPEAMRQLACEEGVFLIDLNAKSEKLFNHYGPEGTKALFVYASPGDYPGYPDGIEDNTHFSEFGAYELARLVVEEIKEKGLPLAMYVKG
ncbi:rhamnogalacturonan acetylesterase [Caldanaerobius polysaccharolyticus]|uniref:rhamnogalacturonan acetylesterase n=1 Tax=Caldanaerobius polysaccharolyticus TaxID=44256 RepID=UPI00068C552F|nr:rhamnogalacturonan acetylesterase [Caldanaerobius polysaccharolyticus]